MKTIFFRTILVLMVLINTISIYCQTNWTKYSGNPVLTKGPDNFDLIAIGQPTALFENDTIKMWYAGAGADMKCRICYAYSTDGVNWVKHPNPVIDVGSQGEWDRGWLDTPEIVKDNTGYKMYYYGDTIKQFASISSAIGVAVSGDGINWTKCPDNPILTRGDSGNWDGNWVESPAVIFDTVTEEYKMWFNGVDTTTWKIQIGLATSDDGINWTKYNDNPVVSTGNWGGYDDIWLGTPTVIKSDSIYEMWYSATSTNSYNPETKSFDTINICYATSADGISWTKYQDNPLFNTFTTPYDSLVDRGGPWAPCVIYNYNIQNYMMWFEAHGVNSNYTFSFASAPKTNTGVDELYQNSPDLIISSSPFNGYIIIKSNEELENAVLVIYNLSGQIVFSRYNIYSDEIKIDRNNLKSGMYIVQLINTKKSKTGKFIVD